MEPNARQKFGANIAKRRRLLRMSQEQLAEKADLHRTYVGAVERGERNVSLDNIVKIARALRLTPAELLEAIE